MANIAGAELKRLRESEEKYRKKFEQARDAILDIDPQSGAIISANARTAEVTGYSTDELLRKKIWQLHPPEEWEEAKTLFKQVQNRGTGYNRQ